MATYNLTPGAVRKLKRLLRKSGVGDDRPGPKSALAFDKDYALPFAVQWAQSAEDGDGSWIIWLPTTDLVVIPEGAINPASALEDAEGDYPTGWYVLTASMLNRTTGGTLYLNISLGDSPSAAFSSAPTAASDDEFDVPICTASVNSTTGERKVRQFVTSAITVGGSGGDGGEYGCDESSISRIAQTSQSGEAEENGNDFYIKGFGKWTVGDGGAEVGSYHAPTTSDIEVDGSETTFAVICRDGNSSSANGNTLAYRKLRIKSVGGSSPFAYKKSTTTDPDTHQPVTLHKLVNCCFYWNGELQTLADFDVSGLLGGGTVYLRGTQSAPSSSDPDPDWTWTLGTAVQQAPANGKALNYKLYDFAQSKVAVDYRTTFLALEDHTQKAKATVGKPNGDASIVLDASGDKPKLVISDGTNTVTLDLADVDSECGGAFALHELKYKDGNGDIQKYHGLFCGDIDLTGISAGKTIKDVSATAVGGEPGGTKVKFTYSDDTSTEFTIYNGLKGRDGSGGGGGGGEAPEITAEREGDAVKIFADGDLIATIFDGKTPVITASKDGGITTIYANGQAIATIADGSGGSAELPDKNVVTGVTFAVSGGKLKATVTKENLKTGATSQEDQDVCDIGELDVVVSEGYSTSTHQFTNERKKIQVIGTPTDGEGQDVFTSTPHSGE